MIIKKKSCIGNHLGNVLTVISDRNFGVSSGGSLTLPNGATIPAVDYYDPDMLAANDYYPFGMLSRTFGTSDRYRFGFNGQENDNEIKGRGNMTGAQYWEYDARIGRRWNLDPRPTVGLSPYATFNNNPIWYSDPLGDTSTPWMPRHPINGPRDYGYVPYNAIGSFVNGVQSFFSKGGDYVNAAATSADPIAGLNNQFSKDYNAVKGFVSGEIDYFKNTPNDKIIANTKEFFTNPDNYFQAFENTLAVMVPIAAAPRINVTKNFTLKSAGVVEEVSGGYDGVKAASKYLQQQGVPREYRKMILQSFEVETISLKSADNATFGLRFFGGAANQSGRYLFPTITNYTNRIGLALPQKWNSMSGLSQFQIAPGSTYIFGRAASQGGIYSGGSLQMYINRLSDLLKQN